MRPNLRGDGQRRQPGAARDGGKALVLFIINVSTPIYRVVCGVSGAVLRFYKYVTLEFSPQPYKVDAIVVPIYQMRKVRLGEGNRLVQGHAVSKRQRLDWIHSAALQGPAPH